MRIPRGSLLFILLWTSIGAAGPTTTRAQQLPVMTPVTAQRLLADLRHGGARVTVVNFWATWCIPCREEFPGYVRLGREFEADGVEVVFVSTDYPEDVPEARHFLSEQGVTEPSYLKVGRDEDFVRAIHDGWSGALPATALIGPNGGLVDFWEGKTSYEDLKSRVLTLLH